MKAWWKKFRGSFDPTQGWSGGHKILTYVIIIVLLILLVFSGTIFKSERVIERVVEVPAKELAPTSTPTPRPTLTPTPTPTPVIKEVTPQSVLDELAKLNREKVTDQGTIADLRAEINRLKAPAPTPAPIIWPKTSMTITSDEARSLLTQTFPNRRMTGAHFRLVGQTGQAALYTVEQFKEIRSKMPALIDNRLPWPSLIDKVIGTFQEPGIEDLPVGWAYPTSPTPDLMYLITILYDNGRPKIFGFDPLDKTKIWEIGTDPRVEAAIVR